MTVWRKLAVCVLIWPCRSKPTQTHDRAATGFAAHMRSRRSLSFPILKLTRIIRGKQNDVNKKPVVSNGFLKMLIHLQHARGELDADASGIVLQVLVNDGFHIGADPRRQ